MMVMGGGPSSYSRAKPVTFQVAPQQSWDNSPPEEREERSGGSHSDLFNRGKSSNAREAAVPKISPKLPPDRELPNPTLPGN